METMGHLTDEYHRPVTADDVREAHSRIRDGIHRTPPLTSRILDQEASRWAPGIQLVLKPENLQKTGAFKIRGALNAISQLTAEQRQRGVVAYSSGNHAGAIAYAAQRAGVPAVVVMPHNAPAAKKDATIGYGAEVIEYDPSMQSREAIATALAEDRGVTLIPPFDHPHVIAGQGTAALELLEDVPDLDVLIVPVGGGGLIAGSALIAKSIMPDMLVYGVEPTAGNDVQQSVLSGQRVLIDVPDTIADGARTRQVGELTFPIIQDLVEDIVTVDDVQILHAMRLAASRTKLVMEPTGVLALAAALVGAEGARGPLDLRQKKVGVIVSGGNADLSLLADEPRVSRC